MITAEHWMEGINSVLDEYGLSREEFWKDPKAFLDNLDDMDAKLTLCLLYTSPSPRDPKTSRMPSSA